MSKPEKNNDVKPEEKEEKYKNSDNSIFKIVLMNVITTSVLFLIFLGVFITMQKSMISQQKNTVNYQEVDENEEAADDEVEKGIILDMGEFTMILADVDVKRYLKVAVALEVTKTESDIMLMNSGSKSSSEGEKHGDSADGNAAKKIVEEMDHYKPAIRDSIITILSSKVSDELSTTTGKELSKDQIKEAVDAIFAGEREVIRVSFGQFIIQ